MEVFERLAPLCHSLGIELILVEELDIVFDIREDIYGAMYVEPGNPLEALLEQIDEDFEPGDEFGRVGRSGFSQNQRTPEKIILDNTFEENWTRAEAIRTVPFWVLSLSGMSIAMLSTGLFFHLVSIFADNGFSSDVAVTVFFPAAISTAVFNILGGFLSDRIDVRLILALSLVLMAAALILAPFMSTLVLATIFGIMLGGLGGLSRVVNGVVWPNYFGRKHLGSISGLATTILVLGAALGPMPIGIARDVWGSYDLILIVLAVIPIALAAATLLFGEKPTRDVE
jgi:predicted MFS family arabinose efflux permease